MNVCKHGCARTFEIYFIKPIEQFFTVYISSSEHSGAGRILESYANPRLRLGFVSGLSRVCITAFTWQLKHPEEGNNAETSVNVYRHYASCMNILTFTCKFKELRSFLILFCITVSNSLGPPRV